MLFVGMALQRQGERVVSSSGKRIVRAAALHNETLSEDMKS